MKYICTNCGKEHEEWPSLAFIAPDNYHVLSEQDKAEIATLSSDFCVITHEDQTDRFIRVVMIQKVNDHCEDLDYGLWVSLSEKSFSDYETNYKNYDSESSYFGWLCNDIPEYDFCKSVPVTVYTRKGGLRPYIVPHEDFDHQLVHDFYNGISKTEAYNRISAMSGR